MISFISWVYGPAVWLFFVPRVFYTPKRAPSIIGFEIDTFICGIWDMNILWLKTRVPNAPCNGSFVMGNQPFLGINPFEP